MTGDAVGLITRLDSNGREYYAYQWRDASGRRRTKSLKKFTKAEAKKIARDLEAKRGQGRLGLLELDPSTCTLAQLREHFLEHCRERVAAKSLARYDTSLRMLMADLGETFRLRNLTAGKLAQWASQRRKFGGKQGRGMSAAGVNTDLRHIRTALNFADRNDLLERAPSFRDAWLKTPPRRSRHLEPEQIEALLKAEVNPDWRRLWVAHFWTGCRRGELFRLNWNDIRWEPRPMAHVIGKGERPRWVPLLPPVVEALGEPGDLGPVFVFRSDLVATLPPLSELRAMVAASSRVAVARKLGVTDVAVGRWLRLGYPPAQRVHIDTVSKRFKLAAKAAGLPDSRLHDARHTTLTYLLSKGVRPRLAQEIAGHASITTTEGYARQLVDVALYDEAAAALGFVTIT